MDISEARFKYMWTFLKESNFGDLGDVAGDMKCTICSEILIDAHSSRCGCRYCLGCIRAYLNGGSRLCPGDMEDCRLEPLDIGRNVLPDHAINHRISKLTVACRHWCGCRCELRSMEEHERACGRRPISCPYVNAGCTAIQLASDSINEHLVVEGGTHAALLMARIDALQGEISSVRKDANRLQLEVAAMRLAREEDEMRARQTNKKMDQTEQEVANLRNENRLIIEENISLRAEMERHAAEHVALAAVTEQHLAELRARVESQGRDIELLREKCSPSEEKIGELEWQTRKEKVSWDIGLVREVQAGGPGEPRKHVREVVINVEMPSRREFDWPIDGWAARSQLAREGICEEIFSDPFYSHENGYKMCLSAWPDGYGARKSTHLSVYFHLMPGKFDNILSWPFTRVVTLSLVDPDTGTSQASRTVSFQDLQNSANWARPTSERNGGIGTGLIKLVELRTRASSCRDDAILIRCVVE